LHRIVALRELGVPLQSIGAALDGEPDLLAYAMEQQLGHVEAELTRWEWVRRRLEVLMKATSSWRG
jgi:MerR family transcriptional regulator, thiopeptide resistance regulator